MKFMEELQQQRWDDHRYYHHNRINQFLHFLSACCFVASYILVFFYPAIASLIGWILAMLLRQAGHFFFEPKDYDEVNQATHEYKEQVKVGYNLQRKVVLLIIWAAIPILLWFDPTLFNLLPTPASSFDFIHNLAICWLILGLLAIAFRTLHLFKLMSVQSGLVWCTKIITDPFHDIKIYHKSFFHLLKGEMYDDMSQWYTKN